MKVITLLILLLGATTFDAFSQPNGQARKKQFNLENGVALQGYDPVAYFTTHKAIKGSKELGAIVYEGVTYHFASASNKEIFKRSPATYEPQYGGWCAFAMGTDGSKVEVDPETFKIIDGKLYLFYNRLFNNTLKSWNKNEAKLKKQADLNWLKIYT